MLSFRVNQIPSPKTLLLTTAIILLIVQSSYAVDGVAEINQTCAVQTGCLTGDGAGYPIEISASGSYRLTSDLTAGNNQIGIQITASDVTLDMNGFRLVSASSDITSISGIIGVGLENIEIRNGTVRGFRGRGIFIGGISRAARIIDIRTLGNGFQGVDLDGDGHLVSHCTSSSNLLWGFSVDGNSLIIDSVAENNADLGLLLGPNTGYRGTLASGNNGGNANAQISQGVDLGLNLCGGDAICP